MLPQLSVQKIDYIVKNDLSQTDEPLLRDCDRRADVLERLMKGDYKRSAKNVLEDGGAARHHTYTLPAGTNARAEAQEVLISAMFCE